MPRAIWSGTISFGLVSIPARLYTGVHEHSLRFHLVHEKDDGPIGYQKVCKLEDEPVPNDEIAKVFEFAKGEFVRLDDEDFEAARSEGYKTIDIQDFVPYDRIDPVYFAHTYLVAPDKGAERPYALLVKAMEESGLAGIAKFVMRDRQYLGCLRVRDRTLTLEQMHFHDEIDEPKEVRPQLPKVSKKELDMALRLVDSFAGDWQPGKYEDTYRKKLCEIVEAKRKGKEVHVAPPAEEEAAPDLFEALRRSIAAQGGARKRSTARRSPGTSRRKPAGRKRTTRSSR